MPRRRFLLIFGIGCVLAATLVIALKGTAPNSSWLPNWIAEVKPAKNDLMFLRSPVTGAVERLSEAQTRKMPLSFADFGIKMERFLERKAGWNTYPKSGPVQGWVMETPTDTQTIAAIPRGERVTVYSTRVHHLNWLEKAQHSMRQYFGANE